MLSILAFDYAGWFIDKLCKLGGILTVVVSTPFIVGNELLVKPLIG